jgi:hypothetical protein
MVDREKREGFDGVVELKTVARPLNVADNILGLSIAPFERPVVPDV